MNSGGRFGEGLQAMGKGAVMRLCIPAALGYGERATGPIPANADLVFQVELVELLAGVEAVPTTAVAPA